MRDFRYMGTRQSQGLMQLGLHLQMGILFLELVTSYFLVML